MRTIVSLDSGWLFARLSRAAGEPPVMAADKLRAVSLPHVWNKDAPAESECCLYRLEFSAEPSAERRAFLAFDAVCGVARVFLNGAFLGEHRSAYSRFVFEATRHLRARNTLEVLADNTRLDDVNPLLGDFTYWGGIPRPVTLVTTGLDCFDPTFHGAPGLDILEAGADGVLRVSSRVSARPGCTVEYIVEDAEGRAAARRAAPACEPSAELFVENARLWDGMADPYLYRCTARLVRGGEVCDEISLPFGFRDVSVSAKEGFFLNGRRVRLNGVARHHDRDGAGCAPSEAQIDEDFALIREIGANAVRLSHYQHPQSVYDRCDRAGLVAWAEIPMLSMPEGNRAVVENACAQLTELILQSRHHPSVCMWGVQNEIAMTGEYEEMYRSVKKLCALAKRLDPARLTAAANLYSVDVSSRLNFLTDIVGYNIYFGWYYGNMTDYAPFFEKFHAANPEVALGVSEYGVDCNVRYHSDRPECKDYSEEFQCVFHENAYEAIRADGSLWGSFVWNMFDFSSAIRDEGGIKARNCKGLVSYDRALKKDAFYYYKACWSSEPFVYIASRRFENRCGETASVRVYSNLPRAALAVNGSVIAEREGRGVFVFENVPLSEETVIEAFSGDVCDKIVLRRVQQPDKSYVYPKKGQGNRVTNWFLQKENEDADGFYSVRDKIGELLADERTAEILERELPDIVNNPRARSMGGMTLMRVLDYNSAFVTKEQVMDVNAKLNAIPKPERSEAT